MSEPPRDSGGLTSGDPLHPGEESPRREPREGEAAGRPGAGGSVGESGPARPAADAGASDRGWERPAADAGPEQSESFGGYTSAPPPGVYGGGTATADAPYALGTHRLAGWWSRVGATLVDLLIIGVGGLLLLVVVGAVFSVGFFASEEAGVVSVIIGLMLAFAAFAVVSLLYAPWMMARTDGRTLGRMAMGIRVVRANGQPVTFGWAMLREVAVKWLLFGVIGGSVTFGLGYFLDVLWPLWDEENRALHDFIVDSRVVRD